jgi:hypothetical protein
LRTEYFFIPSEGPLTRYYQLLIGTLHRGQYQIHLRGYEVREGWTRLEVYNNPCLEVGVDLPGLDIESWADWKALLESTPGKIQVGDDYDENVISSESFIQMVEEQASPFALDRNGKPLSSPYNYIHNSGKDLHKIWTENPNDNWKDAEGYSFSKLLYV